MFPVYPHFEAVSLGLRPQIHKMLLDSQCSISSFSFANIYLFRNKYNVKLCLQEDSLLISGAVNGKTFFSVLGKIPPQNILTELLNIHDYWRLISEKQVEELAGKVEVFEDRGNFEYLYLRTDLAELPGNAFQKKRNLVNAFKKLYKSECTQKSLDASTFKDAMLVLNKWGAKGDYNSAREALELHAELELRGLVFYVHSVPVAYCQGEPLADGKSFAVHFEKAIGEYKGIYQYINQEFAKSLPSNITCINREQDLGDEGLRQAKMTYRPASFVRLFSSKVYPMFEC